MGRDIEEQLFIVEEPGPVLLAGVLFVHGQVPHPVDVGGGGQPAMDRLEGIVFRIDLHPALDRRGGDQLLRVEGDGIALPAVRGQGVDQGVVVEKMAGGTGRRRDCEVEHRDDIPVEVHPEGGRAGELAENVLLVQTGDPTGLEDFPVHGGLLGMVAAQNRLGEQDRDIAVEVRGILQVGNQFAPFAEDRLADDVVHVGERQLHLAVDARLPGVPVFGIVPGAAFLQVVEDGEQPDIFFLAERPAIRRQ